jgi:capsular exopolysaccharide synthesis family protein
VDLTEYLGALKRRWRVIVAAVVVALAAGALTGLIGPASSDGQRYESGAAILSTGGEGTNMYTISNLTILGEVPRRVARALDYEGDPRNISDQVRTEVDAGSGLMWIVANSKSPERAALIANTYARELVRFMTEGQTEGSLANAARVRKQMRRMGEKIGNLESQIAGAGSTQGTLLTAERDAAIRQYGFLADQYQQATATALDPVPIQVLSEAPRGTPAQTAAGPLGPSSPASRLVLAAILGLLAGVALALVLERFDTRIRTKKSAETHFSLPVLAEIPVTPRRMRGDRAVVAAAKPKSPFADAFRLLATGLTGRSPANGTWIGGKPAEQQRAVRSPQTILVTSPGAGEGKTTVTANLAASFAEQGKSVLVLSCDFRSPNIHRMFDVPNDKGLGEALRSQHDGRILVDGHVKKTAIREIRVVPSSAGADNPGGLLSSNNMHDVLQEARENADVVLLDTAPILTGGEAAALFSEVDAVLVVARLGTTTVELAERTSELLTRLGTPVVGIALNGATEVGASRHDYRDSSKPSSNKESHRSSRRRERTKDSNAGPPSKVENQTKKPGADKPSTRKASAEAAPPGASDKEAGALQPLAKSRTKETRRSAPESPGSGPAEPDESRAMKKWEL